MLPNARLEAVYSRNFQSGCELASAFGARAYSSIDELLSQPEIQGVLIATPSGAHEEFAVPAWQAGKHVLCEKPLEIDIARAERMIVAAKQSGAILAGFFPMRCGSAVQNIRHALEEGRFGRLTFLSARIKWWRDHAYYNDSNRRGTLALDGGGALINQGIHAVDLMQWLGGRVSDVTAFAATLAHTGLEVEDTLAASLRFENGALGTITAATSCYPGLEISMEVSGDRGSAIIVNDRIAFWQFSEGEDADPVIRSGESNGGGRIQGGTSDPKAISCEGHRQQIATFCQAINGDPTGLIDGVEACKAVAIVESIYRATRSGKAEPVLG